VKITEIRDAITDIRRCITKPQLRTPEESKICFEDYLKEKHGVTDASDPKCQKLLDIYREYPAMKNLLSYMGMD